MNEHYNAYTYNIDINITHINVTLINIHLFVYNPPYGAIAKKYGAIVIAVP